MRAIGLLCVVGMVALCAGCGTPVRARVIPVANGVGAGVDIGADAEPGMSTGAKVAIGAAALGAGWLAYDKGWIGGGESSDKKETRSVAYPASVGDNNIFISGPVGGDVEVSAGNAGLE